MDDKCFLLLQFADIVQFQQLTGHYDAMTLQGGPSFKGAQYFKTVPVAIDVLFRPLALDACRLAVSIRTTRPVTTSCSPCGVR